MDLSKADFRKIGSGYYKIYVDGVYLSQHITPEELCQNMVIAQANNPTATITAEHDYNLVLDGLRQETEPPPADIQIQMAEIDLGLTDINRYSKPGIFYKDTSDLVVENVRVKNCGGIEFENVDTVTVKNVELLKCYWLVFRNCRNIRIINPKLDECHVGLRFYKGSHHGYVENLISNRNNNPTNGNGDGMIMEGDCHDFNFNGVMTDDNSDAGMDIKGSNVVVNGWVSERNKNGGKFWGQNIHIDGFFPSFSTDYAVILPQVGDVIISNAQLIKSGKYHVKLGLSAWLDKTRKLTMGGTYDQLGPLVQNQGNSEFINNMVAI